MFLNRPFPLFDKASDDSSGSGGGDPPKVLTEEDVGRIVNAAVTSQLKRAIGPAIAEGMKSVDWAATVKPLFESFVADLPEDDHSDGAPDNGAPSKPDPKIAALEAKISDLTTKLTEDAAKLEKAQREARDKDAMAALKSALASHVKPEALDMAAQLLFTAQKRVTVDEQGNPLFMVRKAVYAGGAEEEVPMPLADGVQHWIKSNDGKFFAPPPSGGSGGTDPARGGAPRRVSTGGDGMPKYDTPATNDTERQRRILERTQAIQARHPDLK
jgi:hypothetical protein